MTRRAVLICPGRGTYNAPDLGYLAKYHAGNEFLRDTDTARRHAGLVPLTDLDGALKYDRHAHTRGDLASPLIAMCGLLDAGHLAHDIEIVAVTGNSMGWYTALGASGALPLAETLEVTTTMGTLMHQSMIGGQMVYPIAAKDWSEDIDLQQSVFAAIESIQAKPGCELGLSIDLGGFVVVAGNDAGLAAFENKMPRVADQFPMRLFNHAGFHTSLQSPVAQAGQKALAHITPKGPDLPLIDGAGKIWWPQGTDTEALWDYTLGDQVTKSYDFAEAIKTTAYHFAPDVFIVMGPGTTMGGSVAQSLVRAGWFQMQMKSDFDAHQNERPFVINMADATQRAVVT